MEEENCPHCVRERRRGNKFCRHCGYQVNQTAFKADKSQWELCLNCMARVAKEGPRGTMYHPGRLIFCPCCGARAPRLYLVGFKEV